MMRYLKSPTFIAGVILTGVALANLPWWTSEPALPVRPIGDGAWDYAGGTVVHVSPLGAFFGGAVLIATSAFMLRGAKHSN